MKLTRVKENTYVLEGEELIPLYLLDNGKCILLDTGLLEEREDLDLVFSVTEARRNPYFNMVRDCGDHVEKVIESPFTARQQAPAIYDLNASIYVFRRDFLANNHTGILWDGKIGVTTMMDTGILDIDSEEDYRLMEVIAGHLYQNYPAFGEVRDHIRA